MNSVICDERMRLLTVKQGMYTFRYMLRPAKTETAAVGASKTADFAQLFAEFAESKIREKA